MYSIHSRFLVHRSQLIYCTSFFSLLFSVLYLGYATAVRPWSCCTALTAFTFSDLRKFWFFVLCSWRKLLFIPFSESTLPPPLYFRSMMVWDLHAWWELATSILDLLLQKHTGTCLEMGSGHWNTVEKYFPRSGDMGLPSTPQSGCQKKVLWAPVPASTIFLIFTFESGTSIFLFSHSNPIASSLCKVPCSSSHHAMFCFMHLLCYTLQHSVPTFSWPPHPANAKGQGGGLYSLVFSTHATFPTSPSYLLVTGPVHA